MAAKPAAEAKTRLAGALRRVIELRRQMASDRELTARVIAVKRWQAQRLRATYADLMATSRYKPACEFFLDELYGTRDFTQRDTEALRVVSTLVRMLPERAVVALAMGSELDELSELLDARVATFVPRDALGVADTKTTLDDAVYAAAYRAAGTRAERERQIAHIVQIGRSLDKLAKLPLISGMLHLMRGPADAAGLSHLHEFLSEGFDSFHAMRGASEFLVTVQERETALMASMLGDS